MTTAATLEYAPRQSWFGRAEDWLDRKGKGAWLIAMVFGFIFFWPIGLALLAYMIWSKKMFGMSCNLRTSAKRNHKMMATSGNSAFDAYKEDTLNRLEREQDQFHAFLDRLRQAKDKAEFDQFMDERETQNNDNNNPASAS